MMKTKLFVVCLGSMLALGGIAVAQRPKENVSAARHPNINAAIRLCQQAFDKMTAAQQANEFDMAGHAAKAKQLLDEASKEMKEAAEAANRNKK